MAAAKRMFPYGPITAMAARPAGAGLIGEADTSLDGGPGVRLEKAGD